jgi:uncharacterized protein YfaS (alpha-2-macroglobulin family)
MNNFAQNDKYKKLWNEVQKLDDTKLPKSALEKTEEIFVLALKENNEEQITKSLIYKLMYSNQLEEDGIVSSIQINEKNIENYTGIAKSFLYLLQSYLYKEYYNNNSYKINLRSVTDNFDNNNFETWDKTKFQDKIIKLAFLALHDDLKTKKIENYSELISNAKLLPETHPTLYDFVAYFIVNNLLNVKFNYYDRNTENKLADNQMFANVNEFIKLSLKTDTVSYNENVVLVYQKWLKFRLENPEQREALIHIDIERLNFVKENSGRIDKDQLWLESMQMLKIYFQNYPEVVSINNTLAYYYDELGNSYNFETNPNHDAMEAKVHAIKILNESLAKYPDAKYSDVSLYCKTEIEKSAFSFKVENIVNINKTFPIRIEYKNIDTLFLSIFECSYLDYQNINLASLSADKCQNTLKNLKTIIKSEQIILPNPHDYNTHYTKFLQNPLKAGSYVIVLHTNRNLDGDKFILTEQFVQVADIILILQKDNYYSNKFFVFNSITGKQIENTTINIYENEYKNDGGINFKNKSEFHTDKNGFVDVSIKKNNQYWNNYIFEIIYQNQKIYLENRISENYSYEGIKTENKIVNIFTDRAIYRPGQTVNFKLISYSQKGENFQILKNHKIIVDFSDVNYQKISSLELQTNDFGSAWGSFEIPTNVLTGNFSISTDGGQNYFKVEEYKRPNFEISMEKVEGEFKFNDEITVKGNAKSYSGVALSDAKISYTVTRNPLYFRWWWGLLKENPIEVAFGEIKTDENGEFKINFKALVDDHSLNNKNLYYNFVVNVSVTDINGETQQNKTSVLVSNISLKLSSDISETMVKEKFKELKINSLNIADQFVPCEVEIKIMKLFSPISPLKQDNLGKIDTYLYKQYEWYENYPGNEYLAETQIENFSAEKIILQKKINTADTKIISLENIEKWQTGAYRIELLTKDKFGNTVSNLEDFVLLSEKDKKMPYPKTYFYYCDKKSAQPGETLKIKIGSSYKDVTLFYNLIHKGKIIKSENLKLSDEILNIEIPITEEYRGGISFNLMFLRENKIYNFTENIKVEYENKKLQFKNLTIRDLTVQPGQEIIGQVAILKDSVNPADAEFMATLYDASLDVFAKNNWNFWMYPSYSSNMGWKNYSLILENHYPIINNFYKQTKITSTYNVPNLSFFDSFKTIIRFRTMIKTDSRWTDADMTTTAIANNKAYESEDIEVVMDTKEKTNSLAQTESEDFSKNNNFKARSNFAETAFFFPNLTTNSNGEIFFTFTMPDALTRWNFMGLAHTKNLEIGQIETSMITQKELMVTPNLPRFLRENDKITISAKIANISDKEISGKAKIELYNPETLENLTEKFLDKKKIFVNFDAKSGGNTTVSWDLAISEGFSALGIKILAEGENHIDGEDRILPILTNKMLVTESITLPIRKSGTTNFSFNSLKNNNSSTLRNENFTLEFTANPAWYAVQALPYLMEYPYECNEQTFSRYYSNALASHIANSDPKIKRIFELWKNIPDSKALFSNLEKNQELKSLMLEETPWLLNGKNETERKQKIGILFDLNRLNNENSSALKKLQQNQNYDGGWSWFKGDNNSSVYITQHIIAGFAHLDKLGVKDLKNNNSTWTMVKNAIKFIDNEFEKSYSELKKHCDQKCLANNHLSQIQIHYLYTRSFFVNDIPFSNSTNEAFEYYKNQAAKYWISCSYYEKGMIALALNRYGNSKTPNDIIASLKENAMHNEEMGTYWKYNPGYYWYQAPIETQALLIEVFSEIVNDQQMIEEMKVWLLKQKQIQDWKTTKATTEAIYALLLQGTNLLSETDFPIITIGNQKIDPENDTEISTETGSGYFKKSWKSSEINSTFGDISVTKKQNTVAWGGVYWQYFEELDKIKNFKETPLKINKKLFVERRSGDKLVIVPIEKDKLKVGDQIKVRIEIKVDRDMEYVHLKDMRASCFEPVDYLSGYRYSAGLGYYQTIKDASMNFFISYLYKGTYVFEYNLVVSQTGDFSNGITTMQSMYAPEFSTHSEGIRVVIN